MRPNAVEIGVLERSSAHGQFGYLSTEPRRQRRHESGGCGGLFGMNAATLPPLHHRIRGARPQARRSVEGNELAARDNADAVSEVLGLIEVMRCQHDGGPIAAQ